MYKGTKNKYVIIILKVMFQYLYLCSDAGCSQDIMAHMCPFK